jgi:hypothetical protein
MKITIDGKEVSVREEDFEIAKEDWAEYKLLDGGTVRVKTTVTRIYRLLDEQGQPAFHPDGQPQTWVSTTTLVVAKPR